MTIKQARKLHRGDEVLRKKDGKVMTVLEAVERPEKKWVVFLCDDGNAYLHTELL